MQMLSGNVEIGSFMNHKGNEISYNRNHQDHFCANNIPSPQMSKLDDCGLANIGGKERNVCNYNLSLLNDDDFVFGISPDFNEYLADDDNSSPPFLDPNNYINNLAITNMNMNDNFNSGYVGNDFLYPYECGSASPQLTDFNVFGSNGQQDDFKLFEPKEYQNLRLPPFNSSLSSPSSQMNHDESNIINPCDNFASLNGDLNNNNNNNNVVNVVNPNVNVNNNKKTKKTKKIKCSTNETSSEDMNSRNSICLNDVNNIEVNDINNNNYCNSFNNYNNNVMSNEINNINSIENSNSNNNENNNWNNNNENNNNSFENEIENQSSTPNSNNDFDINCLFKCLQLQQQQQKLQQQMNKGQNQTQHKKVSSTPMIGNLSIEDLIKIQRTTNLIKETSLLLGKNGSLPFSLATIAAAVSSLTSNQNSPNSSNATSNSSSNPSSNSATLNNLKNSILLKGNSLLSSSASTGSPTIVQPEDDGFTQLCQDRSVTFNPHKLGFIPTKFWQNPEKEMSFGELVTDFFQKKNNSNSRFYHKLYNALKISNTDPFYVDFIGVEWINEKVMKVDKKIFARLLGIKTIDGSLFHQQGNFPSHGFIELGLKDLTEYMTEGDQEDFMTNVDFEQVRLLVHTMGIFTRSCTEKDIEQCRWISSRKR